MSVSSPISPVVGHLADLALWEAELAADPQVMASSLMTRLAGVPDPRDPRGRRHPLVAILVLAACATLVVGNDCVTAIWQWAAGTGQDVLARIGARYDGWTGRYLVPSEATFRRVLTRVDGDALDCAVSGYVTDVLAGAAPTPVLPAAGGPAEREQRRAVTRQVTHPAPARLLPAAALDRKLLHGSVTDGGRVFLVAAIDHTTGAILRQRQVADKRGENTALQPLLSTLDTGRVWTLDALHTSKKTARLITGPLHGHYILILKGNQPLVLQAAQALLSGTDTQFAEHTRLGQPTAVTAAPNTAPCASLPATTGCSPAPGKCSGSAATPAASTACAPARKSSTASPASALTWPVPPTSTTTPGSIGAWRTVCIGSGT